MQIAILLYDRFTVLDAIGPYQVLSGIPGAETVFVAGHPGSVLDEVGSLVLSAEAGLADVPHPDVVVVPGGPGQRDQMQDGSALPTRRARGRPRCAPARSSWPGPGCWPGAARPRTGWPWTSLAPSARRR